MMNSLIDADIIAYMVGYSVDNTYYTIGTEKYKYHKDAKKWCLDHAWDLSVIEKHHDAGDLDKAISTVDWTVNKILRDTEATASLLFLTGVDNFRNDVAVTVPYKGNRVGRQKPHHLEAIRQHILDKWDGTIVDGEEADDMLGIQQCDVLRDTDTVICSTDKDLLMIPGLHYNWIKESWTTVDEFTGWYNFYKQLLTGDRADNIVGIKGVGEKTAEKLLRGLSTPSEMMCKVGWQYLNAFEDSEDRMKENADLLYIRQTAEDEWNFNKHDS